MPVASRKNQVDLNETPVSSIKYNEEIDNIYQNLNRIMSFYAGVAPPAEPLANQYWVDTGISPSLLRRFDGAVWRWTGIYFGSAAPANPTGGAFFINSTAGTMAYWNDATTAWVSLPGTGVGFDPAGTNMTATNMQDALKELAVQYVEAKQASQTAVAAASDAGLYAQQANSSKEAAALAQTGAETAKGLADSARTGAETAQTGAEGSAVLAEKWASEATDVAVTPGKYSSKHWAEKSAESAASATTLFEVVLGKTRMKIARPLDMQSQAIGGLLNPTTAQEAATKSYVDGALPTTLAALNALITDADVPSDALATTSTDGLMSAADKTKLDGLGTGGSSVMLTLVHTAISQSTTATAYDVLATGKIIGRSDWHGPELTVLLRRSGSGQIRISLSDGTTTVTAETAVFAVAGTDELTLDTTTLTDGVTWDLTVEALTDDAGVTVERLKILADPVNEFAPVMAVAKAGNSMSGSTFAELDLSYFMAAGVNVDAAGGVVALCDVDLGTATEAELRVTVSGAGSSESVTATVAASGVTEIRCPYPPVASAVASCRVEGRVPAGSGAIALNHYQLHVER